MKRIISCETAYLGLASRTVEVWILSEPASNGVDNIISTVYFSNRDGWLTGFPTFQDLMSWINNEPCTRFDAATENTIYRHFGIEQEEEMPGYRKPKTNDGQKNDTKTQKGSTYSPRPHGARRQRP